MKDSRHTHVQFNPASIILVVGIVALIGYFVHLHQVAIKKEEMAAAERIRKHEEQARAYLIEKQEREDRLLAEREEKRKLDLETARLRAETERMRIAMEAEDRQHAREEQEKREAAMERDRMEREAQARATALQRQEMEALALQRALDAADADRNEAIRLGKDEYLKNQMAINSLSTKLEDSRKGLAAAEKRIEGASRIMEQTRADYAVWKRSEGVLAHGGGVAIYQNNSEQKAQEGRRYVAAKNEMARMKVAVIEYGRAVSDYEKSLAGFAQRQTVLEGKFVGWNEPLPSLAEAQRVKSGDNGAQPINVLVLKSGNKIGVKTYALIGGECVYKTMSGTQGKVREAEIASIEKP